MSSYLLKYQPHHIVPNRQTARIQNFNTRNGPATVAPAPPPPIPCANYDISVYSTMASIPEKYSMLIYKCKLYVFALNSTTDAWKTEAEMVNVAPYQGKMSKCFSNNQTGALIVDNNDGTQNIYSMILPAVQVPPATISVNISGSIDIELLVSGLHVGYYSSTTAFWKRDADEYTYTPMTDIKSMYLESSKATIIDGAKLITVPSTDPQTTTEITTNVSNMNKLGMSSGGRFVVIASNAEASYTNDNIYQTQSPTWVPVAIPTGATITTLKVYGNYSVLIQNFLKVFIMVYNIGGVESIGYVDLDNSINDNIALPAQNLTIVSISRPVSYSTSNGFILQMWTKNTITKEYIQYDYNVDTSTWSVASPMPPSNY